MATIDEIVNDVFKETLTEDFDRLQKNANQQNVPSSSLIGINDLAAKASERIADQIPTYKHILQELHQADIDDDAVYVKIAQDVCKSVEKWCKNTDYNFSKLEVDSTIFEVEVTIEPNETRSIANFEKAVKNLKDAGFVVKKISYMQNTVQVFSPVHPKTVMFRLSEECGRIIVEFGDFTKVELNMGGASVYALDTTKELEDLNGALQIVRQYLPDSYFK